MSDAIVSRRGDLLRRAVQSAALGLVRPYTVRELPAWGKLPTISYRWDWAWRDAPTRTIREKMFGNLMQLDLSHWSDRAGYFLGRWYDLEAQLIIAQFVRPGDTVIDVGAHRGDFTLAAARQVTPSGKVISFEPNPRSVEILLKHVDLNRLRNITLHQCGLADAKDNLTLTVDRGIGHFGPADDHPGNFRVNVPVVRGDVVLGSETPALIKIDVEGFEMSVLRGLADTIARSSPVIITEIDPGLLARSGSSAEELCDFMTRAGYDGYASGSRRSGRTRELHLTDLDVSRTCDAIWIPRLSKVAAV